MDISSISQNITGGKVGAGKQESADDSFADILASANKGPKPLDAIDLDKAKKAKDKAALDEFTAYMKKSVAERMEEAWLKAHGMTKEQFEALPPEEKKAMIEEMRKDIEEKMKQEAEKKLQENTAFHASAI